MKRFLLTIAMICTASVACAQSVGTASVSVEMDGSARSAIERQNMYSVDKVQGFRISIFSDNGQSAREGANSALNKFRNHFDGISSEMVYEMPFFKVYVGDFLNRNEAARMLGVISSIFPKAIIATHEFDLSVFVNPDEEFSIVEIQDSLGMQEPSVIELEEEEEQI